MLNLCNFTLYIVDWEEARSLTLSIIKPSVTKKVNAKIGDTINLADLVTGMPENTTNKINYVISSGKKKAQLDSTNNTLTLLNEGTT